MATGRLISIVDDDAALRDSLANLMRSAGFRTQVFSSAEAFLSSPLARETACLILDVRMPGMNGLELQGHLAAADWRLPVIFITAHADADARARALEAGAVGFLYKPCREKELLSAMEVALHDRWTEETINELLERAIAAHGGVERWKTLKRLTVTAVSSGGLFALKGMPQEPTPREQTVTLHEETASVFPFGQPDWRTRFTPHRVAIETTAGVVVRERSDPRSSFRGHDMLTPWDPLHRAYFNGYAMWTYLTTPFFMLMPGFEVTEIAPWQEGAERWRGLRVRFPDEIASHSKEQDFYFDEDFLLRRHDYHVDVAGGLPTAQYVGDIVAVDGIRFPTKRRAYMRAPDLKPVRDLLMVAIDFSNFRFTA